MPYRLTATAQDDLEGIVRNAALKSRARAQRVIGDFSQAFATVASHPGIGEEWQGPPTGLRFKRVKPGWLVFYLDVPTGETVAIVRIKWATSDLEEALAEL